MARKQIRQKVYSRRRWERLRAMYMSSKHYICERCGQPATECHHKTYLTDANADDPHIAFDTSNLECLCHACHNAEHDRFNPRVVYTAKGDVVTVRATAEQQEYEDARAAIAAMDFDTPHL